MPALGTDTLPYRLACLCDLRDEQGRILLLRRNKSPNLGLCSPIGGKLDVTTGESPAQCAQREIQEEAGIDVPIERLHLAGLISECAFEGRGHWLLFYYRVLGPVHVEPRDMREGRLDWFREDQIDALPLPETDRKIIWPLVKRVEPHVPPPSDLGGEPFAMAPQGEAGATPLVVYPRPGFFAVHIDCRTEPLKWTIEQIEEPER
jgi:8-oxo-dGTP diphosphatase